MKSFCTGLLIPVLMLCGISCVGGDKSRTGRENNVETESRADSLFALPEIPSGLSVEEAEAWLTEHFFDRFATERVDAVRDSAMIANLADGFIAMLMETADTLTVNKSARMLWLRLAEVPEVCESFISHLRMRLFDAESQMADKELFRALLLPLAEDSAFMAGVFGSRVKYYLSVVNKNRPGLSAEPFQVKTHDGNVVGLYDLTAQHLLVYFFDPECHNCRDVTDKLVSDATLADAIKVGRVKVLAVYTENKPKVWEEKCREFPSDWMVGRDISGIVDNELYDLRAMPSLYLLDSRKRVIATDDSALDLLTVGAEREQR